MAIHALTLAINQRLALDVARYEKSVDLRVVPPLCPLGVSPIDFSHTTRLIERSHDSTREWLASSRPTVGQADLLAPHRH